jgi:hypothetical protein
MGSGSSSAALRRGRPVERWIPVRLNEWLDCYVQGKWRQKMRKQELVAEAPRLLVAKRGGPDQDCLPTELAEGKMVSVQFSSKN